MEFFRSLQRSPFTRSVGLLSIGTLAGQSALVLVSPILTRVYSPAQIGVYALYSTVLTLSLVAISCRYDASIPLGRSLAESFHLGLLTILIAAFLCGVFFILARLDAVQINIAPYFPPDLLPWAALGVFAAAIVQTITALCIKLNDFNRLAAARAAQGILLSSVQVTLGLLSFKDSGLLIGDVIGRISSAAPTLPKVWKPLTEALRSITLIGSVRLLHHFREFPLLLMPGAFLNVLATQMIIIAGAPFFSLDAIGAYYLAYRCLYLPGSLIASTVSQVFYGRIAQAEDDKSKSTFSVLLALIGLALPLYLGVFLHALTIFPLIFGIEWELAGAFAFLMALQLVVWLPATATSSVLLVQKKFRESLGINIVHLSLTSLGLFVAVRRDSLFEGVAISSLLAFCLYSFGIVWFAALAKVYVKSLLNAIVRSASKPLLLFLAVQYSVWLVSPLFSSLVWLTFLPLCWYAIGKNVQEEIRRV